MDLHEQKLLLTGRGNNIGVDVEDRISDLPDSLLHHILSFLDIKSVARTCLLSKKWDDIWTSIPTLIFPHWNHPTSLSEINKFMDFLDRTLHLHYASSIQKFTLGTHKHMNASKVHSWISTITKRNVEELDLQLDYLDLERPFFIPVSLFTCQSLLKLELYVTNATHLPKTFSFPKLKSLKLYGVRFTDDCWNEQHFSHCPILEDLTLGGCTWFDVRNFCISTPTLKHLEIDSNDRYEDDGLGNCALKFHAPNLVSLKYSAGSMAKEYVFSSFHTLEYARVLLCEFGVQRVQQQEGYGAAARQFFRALSHVQCLEVYAATLEILSSVDDFVNILPTFHELYELTLIAGKPTHGKSLFSLLKAVPNLRWLTFEEWWIDDNEDIDDNEEEEDSWAGHMLTAGCMFQHLESVSFHNWFSGNARQMKLILKLILKNAIALETVCMNGIRAKSKHDLMTELLSLPRASRRCEFMIEEF